MEPRIAQDTADFRELREKGYIYVDKTEQLYRLANGIDIGGKLFFISRPRRFGKSLMLSTLECLGGVSRVALQLRGAQSGNARGL